jgi:hypothetical protein
MKPNPLIKKAIKLHKDGNYIEAIDLYNEVLRENPDNSIALTMMTKAMEEMGQDEKSHIFYKKNIDNLNQYLVAAKKFNKQHKLELDGFWTYNNEFFSWDFLAHLIKNKYLKLNEKIGKRIKEIDLGKFDCLQDIFKKFASAPWYYIGQGKIFTQEKINKKRYKKTFEIINPKRGKIMLRPHEDWYGEWILNLLNLSGRSYHEKTFKTQELDFIRDFIEKEKITGAIISYITSDKECPIHDLNLEPLLNQFSSKYLKYLKLIFVSKEQKESFKEVCGQKIPSYKPHYDGKVEWVLAYSKNCKGDKDEK